MLTQSRPAELQEKDANIISTLISIQSMLTPNMEVLYKEQPQEEALIQKDAHLSTHEGLVDMDARLEIEIQTLDATRDN